MLKRGSGVLLHITSLPSAYGIGDLGPWAYRFADFLDRTGQGFWQVLPLNPTDLGMCCSPYSSISAFAGNPLLISPEVLCEDGLLDRCEIDPPPDFPAGKVDFSRVASYKGKLLESAHARFKSRPPDCGYEIFCRENAAWLEDFALFVAIKTYYNGQGFHDWPQKARDREPEALQALSRELADSIDRAKFCQYMFFKQWLSLKQYCNAKNIQIVGDLPIYVSLDSADVWASPQLFKLDERKRPVFKAGVPPDYFSQTGQLWGNPVYRWDVLQSTGYAWWIERLRQNFKLFDLTRIDHFRGLVAYWEVPAAEETAIHGHWVEAPADNFLRTLLARFACLPIIAEDLGIITPDVKEVMHNFDIPGMRVLLFAFGEDNPRHPYLPHNYENPCLAYTGTHDNNTIRGWFEREAGWEDKTRLFRYIGREKPEDIHWELIRLLMLSAAAMVIFPLQDILGLGEEARMNKPATTECNWQWRLLPEQLTPAVAARLAEMTKTYGRAAASLDRNLP